MRIRTYANLGLFDLLDEPAAVAPSVRRRRSALQVPLVPTAIDIVPACNLLLASHGCASDFV